MIRGATNGRGIGTGGVDIRESEEGDGGGVQSAEEGKDFRCA